MEEKEIKLLALGFSLENVQEALQTFNGNIELATNFLFMLKDEGDQNIQLQD